MAGGKRPGAGRPRGASNKATAAKRAELAASGEMPLDYMLRIMRDPSQDPTRRDDMAKAVAKFCHPALAAIDHSGEVKQTYIARMPAPVADIDEWQKRHNAATLGMVQ